MYDAKEVTITVKLTVYENVDVDDLVSNMNYSFSHIINDDEVILDTDITNVVEWERYGSSS